MSTLKNVFTSFGATVLQNRVKYLLYEINDKSTKHSTQSEIRSTPPSGKKRELLNKNKRDTNFLWQWLSPKDYIRTTLVAFSTHIHTHTHTCTYSPRTESNSLIMRDKQFTLQNQLNYSYTYNLSLQDSGFQLGVIFPSRGYLAMTGGILLVIARAVGGLLASHGHRPRLLLNILQCTRRFPTTKKYPAHNVNSTRVERPHLLASNLQKKCSHTYFHKQPQGKRLEYNCH